MSTNLSGFIFAWVAVFATAGTNEEASKRAERILASYGQAFVRLGGQAWEFRPSEKEGQCGIDVRVTGESSVSGFNLCFGGELGRVVGLVSCGKESSNEGRTWGMVAIGVVSVSPDGKKLEYRVLFARPQGALTDQHWARSGVLMTKPLDEPFNIMSIAIPAGDSVLLTLQDMSRRSDTVQIEQFVNHCPFGEPDSFDRITQHAAATMGNLKDWSSVSPPDGAPLEGNIPTSVENAKPTGQESNPEED